MRNKPSTTHWLSLLISSCHIYENSKQCQHQIFIKSFSLFGYPAKSISINTQHRTPHGHTFWPIANGKVEKFNRTLGKAIEYAHVQGENWKNELDKCLLEYRSTPHSVTQVVPSDIMFSHQFKSDIPTFQEKQKKNYHKALTRLDGHKKKNQNSTLTTKGMPNW